MIDVTEPSAAGLEDALGDGHKEKRLLWRQEGYGHNALFEDFVCPGEVGFDQGWLACKKKVAALLALADATLENKDK